MAEESKIPEEQPEQAQKRQAKTGIGGCLLYPLLFLIAQPFLFVYMLLTSRNSPIPMAGYRIFWPYLIYDLVLLGAVATLLSLFVRKKTVLPAMFVAFLALFSILSALLANIFWRLPEARVTGREPILSHFVMLFQTLILVPYFVLDARVKNTFVHELDGLGLVDRLVKPCAGPAERLYGWLVRQGKRVFLYVIVFVILAFLLGVLVDTVVLNIFLR